MMPNRLRARCSNSLIQTISTSSISCQPFQIGDLTDRDVPADHPLAGLVKTENNVPYEFEPEEDVIIGELLPKNMTVQFYGALLENAASNKVRV